MKRTPLARRTRLVARKALQAKTPLKRGGRLARAPFVQKPPKPKLTPRQKRPLVERSGGMCEIYRPSICWGRATDVAHRIGEGSGGRHGEAAEVNDRLSNVLHACRRCHDWAHANRAAAERRGWMLRNGARPTLERVWYRDRRWVLLDDAGGWRAA